MYTLVYQHLKTHTHMCKYISLVKLLKLILTLLLLNYRYLIHLFLGWIWLLLLLRVLLSCGCQMIGKLVNVKLLRRLLLMDHLRNLPWLLMRHKLLRLLLIMLCLILHLILNLLQLLLLVLNLKLLLVQ